MPRNKAFTIAEILIALSILVMAMVPVFSMLSSSNVKTSFNEYYVFAHVRASRILDSLSVYPYDTFRAMAFSLGEQEIPKSHKEPPMPPEYLIKLAPDSFQESWKFVPVNGDKLGKLVVSISWKFPGNQEIYKYSLSRLVSRPDHSLVQEYPLQ